MGGHGMLKLLPPKNVIHTRLHKILLVSTHLSSGVARSSAEGLIAVDNGVIHDLGIGQDKARVGWKNIWPVNFLVLG